MKRNLLISVLAAALLLSSCSSGQKNETTTSAEETTATAAAESTVPAEMNAEGKPEDFADVVCYDANSDEIADAFASDFNFIGASFFKDDNGVYRYPNFPANKDIVITFKCDKEFYVGDIWREDYPEGMTSSKKTADIVNSVPDSDGEIAAANERLKKYLTSNDGVYKLTIPAEYVEQDYAFHFQLYTKEWARLDFKVCCLKEDTLRTTPKFPIEDHADIDSNMVDAGDFDFGNAELPVIAQKHRYRADYPKYAEGQDVAIKFTCKKKLETYYIGFYDHKNYEDEEQPIERIDQSLNKPLVCSGDTYILTIPGEHVVAGRLYVVNIVETGNENNHLLFSFQCN